MSNWSLTQKSFRFLSGHKGDKGMKGNLGTKGNKGDVGQEPYQPPSKSNLICNSRKEYFSYR